MGFETCGPNEVMVVSGCCHTNPVYIHGGCVFVWPGIQKVQRISLNTMTMTIETPLVNTRHGVPISVTGIAQVKVHSGNEKILEMACELFLGKSEKEIKQVIHETLQGHQGTVLGDMTVEEICKDRKRFSRLVFEIASSDLIGMGVRVVSYTVKDIQDSLMYLKSLGMTRTAQVKRDARIGEAEAERDAVIKAALAEEKLLQTRYACEIDIAKYKRDFELKKTAGKIQVQTNKAQADLAYQLQLAKVKQKVKEEVMEVMVIERSRQAQIAELEVDRNDRELEARVRKSAEAEKFRLEKLAEADRVKTVLEAQAKAELIKMQGEAEAFAIEACAKAEVGQMLKKADAWKDYQEAAMIDIILETLPKIAAEVSAPITNVKRLTLISCGHGDVGALKLTSELMDIIGSLPTLVENVIGHTILKPLL